MIDVTGCIGFLLASLVVGILHLIFDDDQMYNYGWRIPFWFGVIVALFGIWMRSGLPKSQQFQVYSYLSYN